MGHLHPAVAEHHEAGVGEPGEHAVGDRRVGDAVEFAPGDPPAGVVGAVAQGRQAQQDAARGGALGAVQLGVDPLSRARDRRPQPAGLRVAREREAVTGAAAPGLPQRVGEQGERARFGAGGREHGGDEVGVDEHSGPLGRGDDDRAQLLGGRRADQHLRLVTQRVEQAGQARDVGQEVGAHAQHHGGAAALADGDVDERVDERRPLLGVVAQREDLLELVDHQQRPRARRQRGPDGDVGGRRVLAQLGAQLPDIAAGQLRDLVGQRVQGPIGGRGQHDPPGVVVGDRADQAGSQQRGLAATGGAEDRDDG